MLDKHFNTVADVVRKLEPSYPVFCIRKHELERMVKLFVQLFPGVIMYAVKCNPNIEVMRALYEAGIKHFDTASISEVALAREHFPDASCYFMHPVKGRAAIMTANQVYNINHYVIDHENELDKLTEILGEEESRSVIVRFATSGSDAQYNLSEKFGAFPEEAAILLKKVKSKGFLSGLAFHVGSQCREPSAYKDAIHTAANIVKQSGQKIEYLDIGGGFPVSYVEDYPPELEQFMTTVTQEIERANFGCKFELMCEPGRALVASAISLIVQVQLRKDDQLYINDGIYQSLSETISGNIKFPIRHIKINGNKVSDTSKNFKIFGVTCDNLDMIPYPFALPHDINEGDWIEIGQIGAYSNANASRFNGFMPETFVTVNEPPLEVN